MQVAEKNTIYCICCNQTKPLAEYDIQRIHWLTYYIPICKDCRKHNKSLLFWEGNQVYLKLSATGKLAVTNILRNETPGSAALEAAEYIYLNTNGNKAPEVIEYLKKNNYFIERDEVYFNGSDRERADRLIYCMTSDGIINKFYNRLVNNINKSNDMEIQVTNHDSNLLQQIIDDLNKSDPALKDEIPYWLLEKTDPFSFRFPVPQFFLKLNVKKSDKIFIKDLLTQEYSRYSKGAIKENDPYIKSINLLLESFGKAKETPKLAVVYIHIYLITYLIKVLDYTAEDYYCKGDELNSKKTSKLLDKVSHLVNDVHCSTSLLFKLNTLSDTHIFKVLSAINTADENYITLEP